jgi:hypothetical protein
VDTAIHCAGKLVLLLPVAAPTPGCARRPHHLRTRRPCPWEQRAVIRVVTPRRTVSAVNVIVTAAPPAAAAPACGLRDVAAP